MNRPNLTVVTRAHAKRLVLEAKDGRRRATGLDYIVEGQGARAATARKSVILAAGAIGSPQLLQLSGVGPGPLLSRFGIPVFHEMAGVGEDLHDHLQIRMVFKVSNTTTLNTRVNSLWGKAAMGLEYLLLPGT